MVRHLIERGLQEHHAGRLREAEVIYKQALELSPRDPDALHLLGVLALQNGDAEHAVTLIEQAVQVRRKNPAFFANLAQAYSAAQRPADARTAYQRAAKLDPRNPQFAVDAANCLALQGHHARAEQELRAALRRHPDSVQGWFNLANAVRDLGRAEEALDHYRKAIRLEPAMYEAHNNLAGVLFKLGRLADAEREYRATLAINSRDALLHCNLASVLIDQGKFDEAETPIRQALALDPQLGMAHSMMGAALGHRGRVLEALQFHRRAVELDPADARALTALGLALHEVGRPDEGAPLLERALTLKPDSSETRFLLATLKLAIGDFAHGWTEFRHRPARLLLAAKNADVTYSLTLPQDLAGKHLCIAREQGIGDELFFLRFAPHLRARGARISLRATPKIVGMLQRMPLFDLVIPESEPLPAADFTMIVGDLPLAASIGMPAPTLAFAPLPAQLEALKQHLAQLGPPPYLGLTWRAGTLPEQQAGKANWALFKEIPLEQLGITLRGAKATLLALQRNPRSGEIAGIAAAAGAPVHDLSELNEDLEGMLALLALIDDYVGVSNTNMHLRAGVGRSARVLVPVPSEWRWMAAGDESPWFPGFRVYRQGLDGDWRSALERLTADIRNPQAAPTQP